MSKKHSEVELVNMGRTHKDFMCHVNTPRLVKKIDAVRQAAELSHEIKRLYCHAIGIPAGDPWSKLKYTQRESVTDRVMDIIEKGDMSPKEFHNRWMNRKKNCGWRKGRVFSRANMTDPFIDEWENLPMQIRMMDTLFVDCVSGYLYAVMYPNENVSFEEEAFDSLIDETDMTMFERIEHCVKDYPHFLSVLVSKFEEVGLDIKPASRSSKRAYAKKVIRECVRDKSVLDSVIKVLSL